MKQALLLSILLSGTSLLAQNTFPTGSGTNVGIGTTSPSARLEVTSGTSGVSGVKLTNMTSASATSTGNSKALSVDSSGNIILTPIVNSTSAVNVYNTNGTLTSSRVVTMTDRNFTFTPTNSNSDVFINGRSGFMGLGTLTPTSRLEVNGTTKTKNLFADHKATGATSFATELAFYNNSNVFGVG